MPVVFHVGGTGDLIDPNYFVNGLPVPPDFHGGDENFRSVDYMGIPVPPAQTLATMIFDGVLERFPGLRIGVMEQGAIWVPSWMRQMESAFEAFVAPRGAPPARSRCARRSTCTARSASRPYPTEDVGWIVEQGGADLVLFSSDYPHVEGGRRPVERFEASLGDAGDDVRRSSTRRTSASSWALPRAASPPEHLAAWARRRVDRTAMTATRRTQRVDRASTMLRSCYIPRKRPMRARRSRTSCYRCRHRHRREPREATVHVAEGADAAVNGHPSDRGAHLGVGLAHGVAHHDACGVGFVASLRHERSHAIVAAGLETLEHLAHRGATGADPDSGDGAGALIQVPDEFLREVGGLPLPPRGAYAVGTLFTRDDDAVDDAARSIVDVACVDEGLRLLGWRDVPVDASGIGPLARPQMPRIRQFFAASVGLTGLDLERRLYVVRRVLEARCVAAGYPRERGPRPLAVEPHPRLQGDADGDPAARLLPGPRATRGSRRRSACSTRGSRPTCCRAGTSPSRSA